MPYCSTCGRSNPEYANYCYNCGTALRGVPGTLPAHIRLGARPTTVGLPHVAKEKKPRNATLLASIAGLFIMGIGHFYLGDKRKGWALAAISISAWIFLMPIWIVGLFILLGQTPPQWTLELLYYFLWQPNSPIPAIFQAYLIAIATIIVIIWAWQVYDCYKLSKSLT